MPEIAQHGVIAHELAHANSPTREENDRLYGSREKREKSLDFVKKVAEQTTKTRTFLNPYHKYLFRQLEKGSITFDRFVEETHAILIELKFTNPNHLQQVEEAQRNKLISRYGEGSSEVKTAVPIFEGVGEIISNLQTPTPEVGLA